MKTKLLVIRMTQEQHDKFKSRCAASGKTMTDAVVKFIGDCCIESRMPTGTLSTKVTDAKEVIDVDPCILMDMREKLNKKTGSKNEKNTMPTVRGRKHRSYR